MIMASQDGAWALSLDTANAHSCGRTGMHINRPSRPAVVRLCARFCCKLGFVIEKIRERQRGVFPGDHAPYVLRSPVVILDQGGGAGAQNPANPFVIVRDTVSPRQEPPKKPHQ